MKVTIKKPSKSSQKVDIKIDNFDTWSLDHTLSRIILPALLQLKNNKSGIPGQFAMVGGEDYIEQQSFDFYHETQKEAFEVKAKEWDEIFDKMIWSFQQIALEDYGQLYHHGESDYDFIKSNDKHLNPITNKMEHVYEMKPKEPDKSWYDYEGHKLHEERIQEGLELFGKYYRHLWD